MKWTLALTLFYLTIASFNLCEAEIDLSNVEIPDIDDIAAIKERCDSKGGNGTYDKVKTAKDNLQNCLTGLVDFTTLKNEVEESKKTGSMDEVFAKYCNKRPKVRTCVSNFTDALTPCLEPTEKEALNITLDILKQLGEFACYRDGDRIAMFVAEGGIECIKNHTEGIKNCVNSTLNINPSTTIPNSLPSFLIDKKKCDDLNKLQTCVVEELEKCKDSTPANIVDALFRFIKRSACTDRNTRSLHKIFKRSVMFAEGLNTEELKTKVENAIKKRCEINAPHISFENFMQSFNTTTVCLAGLKGPQFLPPLDFKPRIQNCTNDFVKMAEACLHPEEKNFPQFYLDVIYSVIDFVNDNKDKIISGSLNHEIVNCFQSFQSAVAKKGLIECVRPRETDFEENKLFNKKAACEHMIEVQECVSAQVDVKCIKDKDITNLKNNFFAAVSRPCNKKKEDVTQ